MNILYIDLDETFRNYISMILESGLDFDVEEVPNAEEAITALEFDDDFIAMIIDVDQQDNGTQKVLDYLKEHELNYPIIALSSKYDDDDQKIQEIKKLHPKNNFIKKPSKDLDLFPVLEDVLEYDEEALDDSGTLDSKSKKKEEENPFEDLVDGVLEGLEEQGDNFQGMSADQVNNLVKQTVPAESTGGQKEESADWSIVKAGQDNQQEEGTIVYMNQATKTTLGKLSDLLPIPVSEIQGKSFDLFHKNPEVQKRIVKDPANLPHKAIIQLGKEKLDLLISPLMDPNGNYIGPMLTWDIVTQKVKLVEELSNSANELASASEELLKVSSQMAANAEETSSQSQNAATTSEEVNQGVQIVSTNMEEMTASIKEITQRTNESSSESDSAMKLAK